ncbi:MAG: CBS domain-containing protein [Gammaproteobacteria bacterium]|jgi:CBS domain-containing membrane protein
MTDNAEFETRALHAGGDDLPELELTDEDIQDAMQHISGYIDISTADFQEIYHLAHRHALQRLFGGVRAGTLMRVGIEALLPDMRLDQAAASMAKQGLKSLPVVGGNGLVVGMLTETDFLRRLKADTFLELLLRLINDVNGFSHRCHETPVSEAMMGTPITIGEQAGFFQIIKAFHQHEGRSMAVVDTDGRLRGLLLRKDFIEAFHLEELL